MTAESIKKRLEECKRIEAQLRVKNAELHMEIEKSKIAQDTLTEAYQISTLVAGVSKDIVEKGQDLNIDETLEKIGVRLDLNKIFLLRFSNHIEQYKEWVSNESHKSEIQKEPENLVPLMNWVYEKKCYSGTATELPEFFHILCCPKSNNKDCKNCNLILVSIIIENKPWGIMGYAKDTDSDAADLTKKSIMNLSNLLAILIRQKEDTEHLSKLIDKKLTSFKHDLKQLRDRE